MDGLVLGRSAGTYQIELLLGLIDKHAAPPADGLLGDGVLRGNLEVGEHIAYLQLRGWCRQHILAAVAGQHEVAFLRLTIVVRAAELAGQLQRPVVDIHGPERIPGFVFCRIIQDSRETELAVIVLDQVYRITVFVCRGHDI